VRVVVRFAVAIDRSRYASRAQDGGAATVTPEVRHGHGEEGTQGRDRPLDVGPFQSGYASVGRAK